MKNADEMNLLDVLGWIIAFPIMILVLFLEAMNGIDSRKM